MPTVRMILKHLDSDEFLIFTSSSHGGRGAVNDFCAAYDKDRLRFPGQVPVVRLGVRTYQHKKFGKVPNPVFEVVRWTTWDGSEAPPEATAAGADRGRTRRRSARVRYLKTTRAGRSVNERPGP